MTTLHASALILLLALSGSQTLLTPDKGREVIIRIDDIQDYAQLPSFYESEKKVLEYHVAEKVPALLAIIASRFGTNQLLTEQIKEGLRIGVFTAGIHGWHHEPVLSLTRTQQITEMRYAKNRLEATFGIEILTYVPPFGKFNRDTIAALKANDLTVMSSSISDGDIPREEDGILYIPRTVSTAEVDIRSDSWIRLTLESITEGIESSWKSYGIAVVVIHPRQFVDPSGIWDESRWEIYVRMIAWIGANQGDIVRPEAPAPKRQSNVSPFLLSVATFTGLTSTLLIAFNISAGRSRRRRFDSTAPQPHELGRKIDNIPALLQPKKLNSSTKLIIIFTAAGSAIMAGSWLISGKTYLDIGTSWVGLRISQLAFGVGLFEGKIFYSSILTFALTFALGYYFLVEIQSQHPIKAIIVSGLVVLSAAYVFEYTYLFLNHQVLFKYLTQFHWWFNLLAGFVVGFGLGHMRIGRTPVVLFSSFAIVMAVWYLGGYPQLAHKDTPMLLFNNYIGYPATWAYPLNALAKFLSSMATVSLLLKAPSNFPKPAATEETADDNFKVDEIGTTYQRTRTRDENTKRNASNILRAPFRGISRMRRNLFRTRTAFSGSFQDTSCSSCGRLLKLTDRYCDACGRPVQRQHDSPPTP